MAANTSTLGARSAGSSRLTVRPIGGLAAEYELAIAQWAEWEFSETQQAIAKSMWRARHNQALTRRLGTVL